MEEVLILFEKVSFNQIKYLVIKSMALHTQPICSSLNVIICSDLAAGSSNLVAPFCDINGVCLTRGAVS